MNDAVKLLKQDSNVDVRYIVQEIETPVKEDKKLDMDGFLKNLEDQKRLQLGSDFSGSECESSYSEDEVRIEAEIRRHNSEDDIDHGPVLQSLRKQRETQRLQEDAQKKISKEAKKKLKDTQEVKNLLEEATGGVSGSDDEEKEEDKKVEDKVEEENPSDE